MLFSLCLPAMLCDSNSHMDKFCVCTAGAWIHKVISKNEKKKKMRINDSANCLNFQHKFIYFETTRWHKFHTENRKKSIFQFESNLLLFCIDVICSGSLNLKLQFVINGKPFVRTACFFKFDYSCFWHFGFGEFSSKCQILSYFSIFWFIEMFLRSQMLGL